MTRTVPGTLMADLAESVLQRTTAVRLVVRGDSMAPTLRTGDRVTVVPAVDRPSPGQVVALRTAEGLMVHRLVAHREGGTLVTAGDAAPHRDAPHPKEAMLGVVVSAERDGVRFDPTIGKADLWRIDARRLLPAVARRYRGLARKLTRRNAG